MPFSMICDKCGKQMEPYLDPKTNKVHCAICEREMNNVTHFAREQMKALKQYRQKTPKSFSVKCPKCNYENRPMLLNDKVVCAKCHDPLNNLSIAFKNMLKDKLKTVEKDIGRNV